MGRVRVVCELLYFCTCDVELLGMFLFQCCNVSVSLIRESGVVL